MADEITLNIKLANGGKVPVKVQKDATILQLKESLAANEAVKAPVAEQVRALRPIAWTRRISSPRFVDLIAIVFIISDTNRLHCPSVIPWPRRSFAEAGVPWPGAQGRQDPCRVWRRQ